jgi:hypothetical protein
MSADQMESHHRVTCYFIVIIIIILFYFSCSLVDDLKILRGCETRPASFQHDGPSWDEMGKLLIEYITEVQLLDHPYKTSHNQSTTSTSIIHTSIYIHLLYIFYTSTIII